MRKDGFTLVEVLLAAMLLGVGLMSLFSGISRCLTMMKIAREFQKVQWVIGLGSVAYPVPNVKEPEDLVVDPDTELAEGYTFERTVDEKKIEESWDDDKLYVMRTRISWGSGKEGEYEEIVEYVYLPDAQGDYSP